MKQPNSKEVILTIVVGLLIFFLIFKRQWLLYGAVGIGVIGVFSTAAADLITKGWLKLAHVLGLINANILLTAIFFIFLTPIALLRRLLTKRDNLLLRRPERSVYLDRSKTYTKKDLENTW